MSAFVEMVHGVLAGSATVAAANVTAALFCPLAPAPAVNVRVPHPCLVEAVAEARVHVDSATTIVLLVACTLEHQNVSTKVPEAPAVGLLTTSDVLDNAVTAAAVDVVLAVAEGLSATAIVAAMVQVVKVTV